MKQKEKTPEKCRTCPYALGYIQTLVDPCPKCTGKASIFGECTPVSIDGGSTVQNSR